MTQAFWTDKRNNRAGVFAFFDWIFSFFIGGRNNSERARKRGLKRIARAMAANAYGKFFRVKNVEATPEMAEFFYEICKVIAPAQALPQHTVQSTQLKFYAVESFLTAAQRDLLEKLSVESIAKRAEETEEGLLALQLQKEFADLERSFDALRTNAINDCYRLMLIVCKFVAYDYYFLLKKFDLRLTGENFGRRPVFNPIRGEAVVEELKDFLELTAGLDPNRNWSALLQALRELKGIGAINLKDWNNMLRIIRKLIDSEIFTLIIRFVKKDPDWALKSQPTHESIVGWYLETIREEIADSLALVVRTKQNALIDQHARVIFGNFTYAKIKNKE
jgi:hypothetical protein